jgi:hypothetical protein
MLPDPTASSMVRSRSDMNMSGEDRGHQPHQRVLYRERPDQAWLLARLVKTSTRAQLLSIQNPGCHRGPPQVPLIFSQPRCKMTIRMRCSRPWIGKLIAHSQINNNNIKQAFASVTVRSLRGNAARQYRNQGGKEVHRCDSTSQPYAYAAVTALKEQRTQPMQAIIGWCRYRSAMRLRRSFAQTGALLRLQNSSEYHYAVHLSHLSQHMPKILCVGACDRFARLSCCHSCPVSI